MDSTYRLRCNLFGHSSDVRSVGLVSFVEGGILTGSRDKTTRLWIPDENSQTYKEVKCYKGHTNFVTSVCTLPPDDNFPNGLILSASNDNTICAYIPDLPEPVYQLSGHDDTVCAIASGKFGTILSGSWDNTARVWLGQKCMLVLKGHLKAVWAVAILTEHGIMLTGSADKTIKLWKAGKCELTLEGHNDCVRGLSVMSPIEFLSCSNDGTVRHWNITGDCMAVYTGHESYVYGVATLPNSGFATCGEDRTVRIWKSGEIKQTIFLPSQSVWSVASLGNGDIVVGTSDGIGRIFTTDKSRQASKEDLENFEKEVSSSTISSGEIGNIKINELPSKEGLYEPGKCDGQTKMINEGDKVCVYQWVAEEKRWMKIGDVLGQAGGTSSAKGKTTYMGKEYDYVFDVDIDDSRPTLKLPYNISEDPWFAAQKFIAQNDLNQLYLDQVANFIVKNTGGVTLGSQTEGTYVDPFTGASRYVPDNEKTASNPSNPPASTDPFTGAGRYIPQTEQISVDLTNASPNRFFPQTKVLTFDIANASVITGKLKEFNVVLNEDESILGIIAPLGTNFETLSSLQLEVLEKLMLWPKKMLFPVLDVLRLAIRNGNVNEHFCSKSKGSDFVKYLLENIHDKTYPANQLLAIRTFCNLMSVSHGESVSLQNQYAVLNAALNLMPCNNKNIQVAVSTLILNFSVVNSRHKEEEKLSHCLTTIATSTEFFIDGESQFRILVAIGTCIFNSSTGIAIAKSLNLINFVQKMITINEPSKVGECAALLKSLL